jgi:hypothetical protein
MDWSKWYDFFYAKKAWLAAVIAAGNTVYQLVVAATADEAITLDEANGIKMAVGGLIATVLTFGTVFHAKNKVEL